MELQVNELDKGITLIKLKGRMDIMWVNQIETKFSAYFSG